MQVKMPATSAQLSLEQLEDNLGAADLVLDDEANKLLDEASALESVYPFDMQASVRERARALMSAAARPQESA